MGTHCPAQYDLSLPKRLKRFLTVVLFLFSAAMLPAAELKFYMPFNEGVGGTARDQISQLTGSVNGAVWVDGIAGKALQFNGVGANVAFTINSSTNFLRNFSGGAFSITAWIKPDSTKEYTTCGEILNTGTDLGPGWRFLYFYRMLYFRSGNGSMSTFWEANSSPAIDKIHNDEWNHIAVTRSAAGIVSIYINGKKAAATPSAVTVINNSSKNTLTIGAYIGGSPYNFKGIIDEVKIYQGELTPAEIYKETTSIVRKSALNLDGVLDEAIWAGATRFEPFVPAKGFTGASTATMTNNAFMFMLISSLTGGEPMAQTAGLVTYDNEFIYA
ncbi:MAG: hypothetical protein IT583_05275, partial [Verrucomicrobia bacterium]|nr:hypothetical protein [Verrucomicrobiota bacterium]